MESITDAYSQEVAKRMLLKDKAKWGRIAYDFAPDELPDYKVSAQDILEISPAKNDSDRLRRVQNFQQQKAINEQNTEATNNMLENEIKIILENLKNPMLEEETVDALYEEIARRQKTQLSQDDPQLTRKERLIDMTIKNNKRERQKGIDSWAYKSKKIHDAVLQNSEFRDELVRRYGSVQLGLQHMDRQQAVAGTKWVDAVISDFAGTPVAQEISDGRGKQVDTNVDASVNDVLVKSGNPLTATVEPTYDRRDIDSVVSAVKDKRRDEFRGGDGGDDDIQVIRKSRTTDDLPSERDKKRSGGLPTGGDGGGGGGGGGGGDGGLPAGLSAEGKAKGSWGGARKGSGRPKGSTPKGSTEEGRK